MHVNIKFLPKDPGGYKELYPTLTQPGPDGEFLSIMCMCNNDGGLKKNTLVHPCPYVGSRSDIEFMLCW